MPDQKVERSAGRQSPFKSSAQQMMAPLDLNNVQGAQSPYGGQSNKSPDARVRRGSVAAHLHKPELTAVYSPSPAPGMTVDTLKKSVLKAPGTPSDGRRVSMPSNVEQTYVSENPGDPTIQRIMNSESWTPRTQWRQQYWNKSTPWATDRRVYSGHGIYRTTLKPSAKNYNASGRWELDTQLNIPQNSEDIVRQIVDKLDQHCNSTFTLTRAFKLFDRDMSSTIDSEEMRAVLVTFSIDLSDAEMLAVMRDFGGKDYQDGKGMQIKYSQFVNAVDRLGSKHPLEMNTGRFIRDLRANYTRDDEGRRLCTPGFKAPVGCPIAGCFFPDVEEFIRTRSNSTELGFNS